MYQEIHRLREMLTNAGIEHEWIDRSVALIPEPERTELAKLDWGYQIAVYDNDGNRVVSAVEGYGTYGAEADRIEIMGLTSKDEGAVCGWLTAEQVFARIKHWRERYGTEEN